MNSLKRGTGEAYLIVKNNPNIDFSTQIIKGALNIYAYDGQSEGDRAKYIFDIISISMQKDKIRKSVLQGLATEQDNTWNLTHLFALAKLYAQQNDTEVKQAIYDRFLTNQIEGSDWVGANEILELDGLDGLFYIADKFGKYIEQNPGSLQDDWLIRNFQDNNGHIKVYQELDRKAKSNKFIGIYLDNIKQTTAGQRKHKSKSGHFIDIIDEILNSKPFISFKRKRNLTDDEVKKAARRLMEETDNSNIERLLDIFCFYKFPYDSQLILNFAKNKQTGKNRIAEYTIYALKHLKGKEIRIFAIDKIQNSKKPIGFLEILVSNYRKGDHKLLIEIAKKTRTEHKIEQLAGIYSEIYKLNRTRECKGPLEILYDKMNCAIHRNGIVEILIRNRVLSDKIKNEIKFDCNPETRKLTK